MTLASGLSALPGQSIILAMIVTLLLVIYHAEERRPGIHQHPADHLRHGHDVRASGLRPHSLDYATMLTGSISIGVGIDYTIHFLYVVTEEVGPAMHLPEAIRLAFIERGRAMLSNTVAVAAAAFGSAPVFAVPCSEASAGSWSCRSPSRSSGR